MSSVYNGVAGSGSLAPAIAITIPADTDAANAASVNTPMAKLADYIAFLQSDSATRALDSNTVHRTGAEAIAGVKTFSSSPSVPVPTATGDALSKIVIAWTSVAASYGATWVTAAACEPLSFYKDAAGNVRIKGAVYSATGTVAQIVPAGTLPAAMRPAIDTAVIIFILNGGGSFPFRATIKVDGSVVGPVGGGAVTAYFDSTSFVPATT